MIKKLINSPDSCVEDAVQGALLTDSSLKRVEGLHILVRADIDEVKSRCVTIISGGGSGHEPAHAGFIGEGMLSCAVLGNVFASPSVAAIIAAIRVVAGPKGVLLIVKNYTGDRLNFGMAAEIAKQEGIEVMMVIVADDCALPLGKGITGGRGIAGTVLVHKAAGAAAASGLSLADVHRSACEVSKRLGSLGVALSTCTVPGTPVSTRLSSKPGLIEVGMGIHGEPGREQMVLPEVGAADFVAGLLVDEILGPSITSTTNTNSGDSGEENLPPRLAYTPGQRVAVLVNNLGALPVIEMQIVTKGIMIALQKRNLLPVRAFIGPFVTSLEMCGISLSLLMIDNEDTMSLLAAPTTAPAWLKATVLTETTRCLESTDRAIPYTASSSSAAGAEAAAGTTNNALLLDSASVIGITKKVCEKIVAMEPELTAFDAICGDGDCGMVMKKGALQVRADVDSFTAAAAVAAVAAAAAASAPGGGGVGSIPVDATKFFNGVATAVSSSMGGTSGALLELCFRAMATSFTKSASATSGQEGLATAAAWITALDAGVAAIQYYGGASAGMRTMLDAFVPAVEALKSGGSAQAAATAAAGGTEATKTMGSLAGRSNYVTEDKMRGTPDPGAAAVSAAFQVLAECLSS
mmetsp:Transcript_23426/g.39185  ORF Transcript_23426/g.39185 Transcript_23426/m.39185 type:complete len:636 (+) Transcript_23426:38-1945(+)